MVLIRERLSGQSAGSSDAPMDERGRPAISDDTFRDEVVVISR